ncbi:MAG: hypothetical protein K6L76_09635 [Agarilytica sp.]
MKLNFEVDISPEEVKELFEGNMDVLQRSLVEFFMSHMTNTSSPSGDMMKFWQNIAEQSTSMFEQYQNTMTGGVAPKDK